MKAMELRSDRIVNQSLLSQPIDSVDWMMETQNLEHHSTKVKVNVKHEIINNINITNYHSIKINTNMFNFCKL